MGEWENGTNETNGPNTTPACRLLIAYWLPASGLERSEE
jgi:hypothetical protein